MAFHDWGAIYQAEQRRRQEIRKAQTELNGRIDSLNYHAAQAQAMTAEQHEKLFARIREQQEREEAERRERAEREAKERTERNEREFYERLKNYQGPLDPLLKLLAIKSKNPTAKEIRSGYLHAIRKHHPDVGGSEDMAKRINAAYEVLMRKFGS